MGKTQPQVRTPTEKLEKLFLNDFNVNHLRIIIFIYRFQFGFNRLKYCACTQAEISNIIGLDPAVVSKTINELIELQIIIHYEDGFQVIANIDKWLIATKPKTSISKYKGLVTTHVHLQAELIKHQEKEALPWPPDN